MSVTFHPPPRRILIRGVNWLGDAVMTTPALMRLRAAFPDAQIVLFTPEKLADLWRQHPAINEITSFSTSDSIFSAAKKLRALQCDLALILPNSPRSAMEAWLAGIPRRIGYARPWRNFFLTETVATRPGAVKMRKRSPAEIKALVAGGAATQPTRPAIPSTAHQIYEYLHLVAALGAGATPLAPCLTVGADEVEAVKRKFGLEASAGPILGLNPGAEYGPAKRWPVEKFMAAATAVQQRLGGSWLLFGGKGDVELTTQIVAGLKTSGITVFNLAGQTSLRELMALLKWCRVLLTNDTGPMHVAAALGTPVVAPFGSTSPELTAPGLPGDARNYLLKSDAPCSPCFLRECPIDFRCMNGISVDRVAEAVIQAASR